MFLCVCLCLFVVTHFPHFDQLQVCELTLSFRKKKAPLTCAENSTDLWEQTYIFKRQFDYMPFGKIPVVNISPRACSLIRNFLSGLQCQPYSIPME